MPHRCVRARRCAGSTQAPGCYREGVAGTGGVHGVLEKLCILHPCGLGLRSSGDADPATAVGDNRGQAPGRIDRPAPAADTLPQYRARKIMFKTSWCPLQSRSPLRPSRRRIRPGTTATAATLADASSASNPPAAVTTASVAAPCSAPSSAARSAARSARATDARRRPSSAHWPAARSATTSKKNRRSITTTASGPHGS